MGSRVYDNDTSTNIVNDSRVGVADNAVLLQGGSSITNNSTSTTTNYNSDGETLQRISGDGADTLQRISGDGRSALEAVSGDSALTLRTLSSDTNASARALIAANERTSAELFSTTARINGDSIAAVERASRAANDTVKDALRDTLSYTRDATEDYLRYANQNTLAVTASVKDVAEIVGQQGDGNREFAEGLVDRVLTESRTSDEKNILEFLKTSKVLIGILAAAAVAIVVVPRFAKGAKV